MPRPKPLHQGLGGVDRTEAGSLPREADHRPRAGPGGQRPGPSRGCHGGSFRHINTLQTLRPRFQARPQNSQARILLLKSSKASVSGQPAWRLAAEGSLGVWALGEPFVQEIPPLGPGLSFHFNFKSPNQKVPP